LCEGVEHLGGYASRRPDDCAATSSRCLTHAMRSLDPPGALWYGRDGLNETSVIEVLP
jgi:hypothetical protein